METYEWLAGERFLVHRFEGLVGDKPAVFLEMIGYDAAAGDYAVHTYYNSGLTNEWRPPGRAGPAL